MTLLLSLCGRRLSPVITLSIEPAITSPLPPAPPPYPQKITLAHAWALVSFEKISLLALVRFLEATGLYLEGCGTLQPSLWIRHWKIFFLLSVSQFFCLIHSVAFCFSSLQCKKFRDKLTPDKRKIFKEKLQASEVFKDKKSSYPLTWVTRILINSYFEHCESLGLTLYRAFWLTWAASMDIFWNKRKRLHKKFNSRWIVLEHQYGCREDMWKRSILWVNLDNRARKKNTRGVLSPLRHFEIHCIFRKRRHSG